MPLCKTCKTKYWCCWSPALCKCAQEKKQALAIEKLKLQEQAKNTAWVVAKNETTAETIIEQQKQRQHKFEWMWQWSKCIYCWESRFYSVKNPCV